MYVLVSMLMTSIYWSFSSGDLLGGFLLFSEEYIINFVLLKVLGANLMESD